MNTTSTNRNIRKNYPQDKYELLSSKNNKNVIVGSIPMEFKKEQKQSILRCFPQISLLGICLDILYWIISQ